MKQITVINFGDVFRTVLSKAATGAINIRFYFSATKGSISVQKYYVAWSY